MMYASWKYSRSLGRIPPTAAEKEMHSHEWWKLKSGSAQNFVHNTESVGRKQIKPTPGPRQKKNETKRNGEL